MMNRFLPIFAFILTMLTPSFSQEIMGAGATFPQILMEKLTQNYEKESKKQVIYLSAGSGLGLKQLQDKSIDFIFSEKGYTAEELNANNMLQFPVAIGAVVVVVNISGISSHELVLDAQTLCAIFFGRIQRWNHPDIQKLNPKLILPDLEIVPIHRSDASGTTLLFVTYLKESCPEFMINIIPDMQLAWPIGAPAMGNDGVVSMVHRIEGAIGYAEYSQSMKQHQAMASFAHDKTTVLNPEFENFKAAADQILSSLSLARLATTIRVEGINSWPIMGMTYAITRRDLSAEKREKLRSFFTWVFQKGRDVSTKAGFVLITPKMADEIMNTWDQLFDKPATVMGPLTALPSEESITVASMPTPAVTAETPELSTSLPPPAISTTATASNPATGTPATAEPAVAEITPAPPSEATPATASSPSFASTAEPMSVIPPPPTASQPDPQKSAHQ